MTNHTDEHDVSSDSMLRIAPRGGNPRRATHGGQPTAGNPAPVHHRRLGAGLSPFCEERERETPKLKKNMVAHDVMCDVMCGRAGGTASGGVREETAETNQSIMPKNRIR